LRDLLTGDEVPWPSVRGELNAANTVCRAGLGGATRVVWAVALRGSTDLHREARDLRQIWKNRWFLPTVLGLAVGYGLGLVSVPESLRAVLSSMVPPEVAAAGSGSHASDSSGTAAGGLGPLALSRAAQRSLGLKIGKVRMADYTTHWKVPATVQERPAVSNLHVTTRFEGVVSRVLAVPGQALREDQALFEIELTGDSLAAAQAALLDAVQQIAILDSEIKRLAPVARQGGIAAKNMKQLEYERRRLEAQRETKHQELSIRGLKPDQVRQIETDRKLVTTATVSLPRGFTEVSRLPLENNVKSRPADEWGYTLEQLHVTPGSMVKPGESLCDIAFHTDLYVVGHAFEGDVEKIRKLMSEKVKVRVELGDDDDPIRLNPQPIIHLDNHVDPKTQTFRFYVPLRNEKSEDVTGPGGRKFRSWKYRPGQRGHIDIPSETFRGNFVVPSAAVVDQAGESLVFCVRSGTNTGDASDHDDFEPVVVRLVHRDRRNAVVSSKGALRPGDRIALNNAYQLLLAVRSAGGAPHAHSHPH